MRQIPLSNSRPCANRGRYVTLIDDEDYAWAVESFWSVQILKNGGATQLYAVRTASERRALMHRAIATRAFGILPTGKEIDHANGDGLDNRRSNLRIASRSNNMANVGVRANNTSGFKGVSWDRSRSLWGAKIKVNYRAIHLGRFSTAEEAALAYNAAAAFHFGEFARPNSAVTR